MKTLLAKLLGLSKSLLEFYAPILRELTASGVAALLPIALEIVRSLADKKSTGARKREAAVDQLRDSATVLGIRASESLLRLTIESAVSRLKVGEV
jgi:hypothetical protein